MESQAAQIIEWEKYKRFDLVDVLPHIGKCLILRRQLAREREFWSDNKDYQYLLDYYNEEIKKLLLL